MKRFEIVMNQAIEEDFLAMCKSNSVGKAYTKYNDVCGIGFQDPKMGSSIWPQLNVTFVIVCPDTECEIYKKIITSLRVKYPDDGVFCSVSDVETV